MPHRRAACTRMVHMDFRTLYLRARTSKIIRLSSNPQLDSARWDFSSVAGVFVCDSMKINDQTVAECEQALAAALEQSWQARGIDRDVLAKRLILSARQLDALCHADASAFHTYGIYLRATRFALQESNLLSDPANEQALQILVQAYQQDPGTSPILNVRNAVNRKLGEAPGEPRSDNGNDARGMAALGAIVAVLVVLSIYVGFLQ
jgi:hypothetical protein